MLEQEMSPNGWAFQIESRLGLSPAIHHTRGFGNLGTFFPLPVQWDNDLKVAE